MGLCADAGFEVIIHNNYCVTSIIFQCTKHMYIFLRVICSVNVVSSNCLMSRKLQMGISIFLYIYCHFKMLLKYLYIDVHIWCCLYHNQHKPDTIRKAFEIYICRILVRLVFELLKFIFPVYIELFCWL